jgi:SAM-dependent methyltransferase
MASMPSPPESPLLATLFADLGIAPGEVATGLDARDEMVAYLEQFESGDRDRALFTYFRSGWSIADAMLQLLRWRFGATLARRTVLDFASGYGRVTRFLLRELRAEQVWVADVYAEAVREQESRLGVRGLVSHVDPARFASPRAFDAVLVTSLFTHLPEARFAAWLRRLGELVSPGGLLAFTVHDAEARPPGIPMPESGLCFAATSESGSLAATEYGSTWVTEEYVRRSVADSLPGAALCRLPNGVCNFQDLYVAARPPGADLSTLAFRGEPHVFVERCEFVAPNVLAATGWTAKLGSDRPAAIEVWLDGRRLATWPVDGDRPDIAATLGDDRHRRAGWRGSVTLPPGTSRSRAVLLLRVVDQAGHGFPALVGSIEWHLLLAASHELKHAEQELRRTRAELAALAGRYAADTGALRARLGAMQASRFWKLRNRWFALKRLLRLTDEA